VTRSRDDDDGNRANPGPTSEAHESKGPTPCTGAQTRGHPTGVDQAAENRENDPPA
jgi:hypothetical protein